MGFGDGGDGCQSTQSTSVISSSRLFCINYFNLLSSDTTKRWGTHCKWVSEWVSECVRIYNNKWWQHVLQKEAVSMKMIMSTVTITSTTTIFRKYIYPIYK